MKYTFIILFTFLSSLRLTSQESIDLFIVAGQSNARGREGDAAQYPVDSNSYDSQIRLNWTLQGSDSSDGWTTMGPQSGQTRGPKNYFGPEVTFSRKLKEEGYNPAIYKFTQGGSSIYGDWLQPGDGGFLDIMVTDLKASILELTDQGHTVVPKALIWIQGESDADTYQTSVLFEDRLDTIIDHIRQELGDANLPVILGVDEQIPEIQKHPMVVNAQENIATADENIRFSSMYYFEKADKTHLSPTGLIDQGENLFSVYELIKTNEYPLENCNLTSQRESISVDEKTSWGQSFKPNCYGYLSEFTFDAGTNVNTPFTITVGEGADCESTVIKTINIPQIVEGENIVTLPERIYLNKEHSYFVHVESNNGVLWKIGQTNSSTIDGLLRSYEDKQLDHNACSKYYSSNDLAFSTKILDDTGRTLPVELVYFNGHYNNGEVLLKWMTKSEINSSHFNIQKSYDGSTFETIDIVYGQGTSNESTDYTYTDLNIENLNHDNVYYRLVQVDFDNQKNESFTIPVFCGNDETVNVYPTLVERGGFVNISGKYSSVELYNVYGEKILNLRRDSNNFHSKINTSNYATGMYFMVLDGVDTRKIIIK